MERLFPSDAISQPLSDDRCLVRDLRLREGEDSLNDLRRKVRQDLCHFEGNAQGIRLVHSGVHQTDPLRVTFEMTQILAHLTAQIVQAIFTFTQA